MEHRHTFTKSYSRAGCKQPLRDNYLAISADILKLLWLGIYTHFSLHIEERYVVLSNTCTDNDIHSDHSYLDTWGIPVGQPSYDQVRNQLDFLSSKLYMFSNKIIPRS